VQCPIDRFGVHATLFGESACSPIGRYTYSATALSTYPDDGASAMIKASRAVTSRVTYGHRCDLGS
jgi:hypothetical protein